MNDGEFAGLQSRAIAALVQDLVSAGIRQVVVSPGYRNAPLSLALYRCAALQTRVVIDERAAGFAALGASRITNRPTVLCCTSGSALAHYLPAVMEARAAAIPLLVLSANRPYELHRVGAPQALEQTGALSPHVDYEDVLDLHASGSVLDSDVGAGAGEANHGDANPGAKPDAWRTRLAIALAHASRGPVHLDIPLRKPLVAPGAGERPPADAPRVWPSVVQASDEAWEHWWHSAQGAERPVIWHGPEPGPLAAAQRGAVDALAARLGWPVLADALSSSRSSEGAHCHLEWPLRSERVRESLRPDSVLWIGGAPTSKGTAEWLRRSDGPTWTLSPAGRWPDPSHRAGHCVPATASQLAQWLSANHPHTSEPSPRQTDWSDRWRRVDSAARDAVRGQVWAPTSAWWDAAVVAQAARAWTAGPILVGSSLPIRDLDAAGGGRTATVVANRGANGIDGMFATAWGTAWAAAAPVLAVVGDVTASHDIGALLHMPSDLSCTAVVVDNQGGQIFGQLPVRDDPDFKAIFLTQPAFSLPDVARAGGWQLHIVSDFESLHVALQEGQRGGRHSVWAQTDAARNSQVRQQVAAAVMRAAESVL